MTGITTTRKTQPKQKKLTKAQLEKLMVQWRQHNKNMRRSHSHDMRFSKFEDYVDYTFGKKTATKKTFEVYQPSESYRRETIHYPSVNTSSLSGQCIKAEPKVYTGERELLGIATLHKSNAVPIFADDKEYAKDIARMRRN
jgi:hypothetical protein